MCQENMTYKHRLPGVVGLIVTLYMFAMFTRILSYTLLSKYGVSCGNVDDGQGINQQNYEIMFAFLVYVWNFYQYFNTVLAKLTANCTD